MNILSSVKRRVLELRGPGRTIGFTNGCFDLLHAGHVDFLNGCARTVDALFVGINSDESVRRLKGEGRPICQEEHRCMIVSALRSVEMAFVFSGNDVAECLEELAPDIWFKGADYTPTSLNQKEVVAANKVGAQIFLRLPTIPTSSTDIVNLILEKTSQQNEPLLIV